MDNNPEKIPVGQAGPSIVPSPNHESKMAGVEVHHETLESEITNAQLPHGNVAKEETPLTVVDGQLNHEQFELPKRAPDLKQNPQGFTLFHFEKLKKAKEAFKAQKGELKRAA